MRREEKKKKKVKKGRGGGFIWTNWGIVPSPDCRTTMENRVMESSEKEKSVKS